MNGLVGDISMAYKRVIRTWGPPLLSPLFSFLLFLSFTLLPVRLTIVLLECTVVLLECVVAALQLVVELLGCDACKVLAAQGVRREGVARAKEGRIPAHVARLIEI